MGQAVLGVAILGIFFIVGFRLIRDPKPFLASLGRPATDKHIRATRIIGAGFLLIVLSGLVQIFRNLR